MVGRNILIVDDEAPIREMIAVALEMAGYDCLEAENSQQAHAIIVDRKPDLILLDLNLPKYDGRQLLEKVKSDIELCDIPIVVLTTSSAQEDILRSYKLHANAYVTKPVDLEQFLSAVRQIDDFFVQVVRLPRG